MTTETLPRPTSQSILPRYDVPAWRGTVVAQSSCTTPSNGVQVDRLGADLDALDQAMSNRSRFMTLSHAATKSRMNFSCASSLA